MTKPRADAITLNIRAHSALDGNKLDWRQPLIELLRSDAPIEPYVRERLAVRIEAQEKHEIRLELTGHKHIQDWQRRQRRLHRDYHFGELVAARIGLGATREAATSDVADEQCVAFETVDAALTFHKHAKQWVTDSLEAENFASMGPSLLLSLLVQRLTFTFSLPDGTHFNDELFERLPPLTAPLLKYAHKYSAASYRTSDP